MVQQKIILKVEMSCEKRRTQVLKIAAIEKGKAKVCDKRVELSIQPEKDQLEVIGNGVDSVCLTMSLRKKLKHVQVISIEEVKPKAVEEKKPAAIVPITWTPSYNYAHHLQYPIHHCHDEQPSCSIM